MPNLHTTPDLALPIHVKMCRWAIVGGIAGHPVHLIFKDYSATCIGMLLRVIVSWLGEHAIRIVMNFADIRLLKSITDNVRAVFVIDGKLLPKVLWQIELQTRENQAQGRSSPIIIARNIDDANDLPGATLALHGFTPKAHDFERWLNHDNHCTWAIPEFPDFTYSVTPSSLKQLLSIGSISNQQVLPLRERMILKGLMIGAATLCLLPNKIGFQHIEIGLLIYEAVYDVLRSVTVRPIDCHFEPLTMAMVERANAYLMMKSSAPLSGTERVEVNIQKQLSQRLITRREIADLGNNRGKSVKQLVDYLKQRPDGLQAYNRLVSNKYMTAEQWQNIGIADLASQLLTWSPKQTRTHFAKLVKQSLICETRRSANQPIFYELPESLGDPNGPFQMLPMPGTLRALVQEVIGDDQPAHGLPNKQADQKS